MSLLRKMRPGFSRSLNSAARWAGAQYGTQMTFGPEIQREKAHIPRQVPSCLWSQRLLLLNRGLDSLDNLWTFSSFKNMLSVWCFSQCIWTYPSILTGFLPPTRKKKKSSPGGLKYKFLVWKAKGFFNYLQLNFILNVWAEASLVKAYTGRK